jgi:hypothetical protein
MAQDLVLEVRPGGWGPVGPVEITAVLYDAAAHLLQHLDGEDTLEVIVRRAPDNVPRVAYRSSPEEPFEILLAAFGRQWPRYAYQLAHELAHIVSDFERLRDSGNHWFHEVLCETAALFVVAAMARSWRQTPPFEGWHDHAARFEAYLDLAYRHTPEPAEPTLGDWLRAHEPDLRADPHLRELNRTLALRILPLLEDTPGLWPALRHLPESDEPLAAYLGRWRDACPEPCRPLPARIAALLDLPTRARGGSSSVQAPAGTIPGTHPRPEEVP